MSRAWLKCFAVASALIVPCEAPQAATFMATGNDFVAECPLDGHVYRVCAAYIMGVAESLRLEDSNGTHPMCVPENNTLRQIYDIVTEQLRTHPEQRSQALYLIVANALIRAFPCRKAH